jgi:hypothetical protein
VLRYPSATEARRDRLPDVPRGVIARTQVGVREGEERPVRFELDREKVTLEVRGRVKWATPLATGALAGFELTAPSPREEAQLDLLLGIRTASRPLDPAHLFGKGGAVTPSALPRLSVALLEPNRVLREVLSSALVRFARDGNGWDLQLDAVATVEAFLEAMSQRRRNLAVIDCDRMPAADPLVDAVRSHAEWARLPMVILSSSQTARLVDSYTVTMQKPVAMKSLLYTTGILLRG